jgi:flagellar protein FliS
MSHQRSLAKYQESQILTASREQLLLLTYDGLVRFLARAERGIREHDYAEKHIGLTRAQALVIELHGTLDHGAAPQVADNLARIYSYLLDQLALADAEDDLDRLQGVIGIVGELRTAWAEAARSAAQ